MEKITEGLQFVGITKNRQMIHLKKRGINWIPPARKGPITRGIPWIWSMWMQNKQRLPRVSFHVIRDITHKNKWENTRKRKPRYSASAVAIRPWKDTLIAHKNKIDAAYGKMYGTFLGMLQEEDKDIEDHYATNAIGGIPID